MDFLKRIEDDELFSRFSIYEPHSDMTKDRSPAAVLGRVFYLFTDQTIPPSTLDRLESQQISSFDGLSDDDMAKGLFYVYFGCDSNALLVVRMIRDGGGIFIQHLGFTKTQYRLTSRITNDVLRLTWEKSDRDSHSNASILQNIRKSIDITSALAGANVEVGVYRGGSALTALH